MTRRQRLERKIEKRAEWADKARARSEAAYKTAHRIGDMIPPGQPILVGHHSEKHHRRDLARIDSNMRKSIENQDLAAHHESKASGLEAALDRSIFSDDDNAIDALEQRIAEREAEREQMKLVNKLYRKGDVEGLRAIGIDYASVTQRLAALGSYFGQAPHMPYELSNLGGRISADRKRLEYLKQQRARAAKAEESPAGVTLEQCQSGYVRVTFAEKPDREILNALRGAGFHWGGGSWAGKADSLPQEVAEMLNPIDADFQSLGCGQMHAAHYKGTCEVCGSKVYSESCKGERPCGDNADDAPDPRGHFGPKHSYAPLHAREQGDRLQGRDLILCWDCAQDGDKYRAVVEAAKSTGTWQEAVSA